MPEVIAFSPHGQDCGGHPSILRTRLRGRVQLTPGDAGGWLGQIAATAAAIHDAAIRAPAFEAWIEPDRLVPPSSAADPGLWQAAFTVLRQPGGSGATRFIHREFQHFNFLWARGRLTGVVDWGEASTGPPDVDVGHCRLNLAVLFGATHPGDAAAVGGGRPVQVVRRHRQRGRVLRDLWHQGGQAARPLRGAAHSLGGRGVRR